MLNICLLLEVTLAHVLNMTHQVSGNAQAVQNARRRGPKCTEARPKMQGDAAQNARRRGSKSKEARPKMKGGAAQNVRRRSPKCKEKRADFPEPGGSFTLETSKIWRAVLSFGLFFQFPRGL